MAGQVAVERLGRTGVGGAPVAEHAGEAAPLVAVGGHGVDLLVVLDLQGVLDPAQEPVGRRQPVGVVLGDVPAAGHLGQGGERCGRAELGVGTAVHELEGLHRELDVPDPAGPALDLALGCALAPQLGSRPVAQGPQRAKVVGRPPPSPQRGRGGLGPGSPHRRIAGHGHGLQQRLELPGLRPPLPVRPVALDRAGEGPVTALGPQVGIHPVAAAGEVHHRAGLAGVALDEHDVDVARVVELAAAELAHADDGQPLGAREADRAGQHGGRHVGEVARRPLEVGVPEEVAGGDPQVGEPLGPDELVAVAGGSHPRAGRDRRGVEVGQDVERGGIGLEQARAAAAGGHHGDHRGGEGRVCGDALAGLAPQPVERVADRTGIGAVLDQLVERGGGHHSVHEVSLPRVLRRRGPACVPGTLTTWPACVSPSARSTPRSATSTATSTGCWPRSRRPRTRAATSRCSPSWPSPATRPRTCC